MVSIQNEIRTHQGTRQGSIPVCARIVLIGGVRCPETPQRRDKHLKNEIGLRPWRPGTGPRNGNSRKVLAGVLAQVLAKMGVLAGVLAQVLAGQPPCKPRDNTACQHLCQHSGQHPLFASTCASTPASTFLEFPFRGPVPGRQGLKDRHEFRQ